MAGCQFAGCSFICCIAEAALPQIETLRGANLILVIVTEGSQVHSGSTVIVILCCDCVTSGARGSIDSQFGPKRQLPWISNV